jgi:glycosyltransferase involved in cell wall biosynthesis
MQSARERSAKGYVEIVRDSQNMKIVHILPSLNRGGAERVVAELANSSVKEKHEVTVLAAHQVDAALLRTSFLPAVQVRYISEAKKFGVKRYFNIVPWLFRNFSWLAEKDIIHCHLTFGSVVGEAIHIWKKISGRKKPAVVETYHAVGMNTSKYLRWLHSQLAARRDAFALMAEDEYWNAFLMKHPNLLSKIIPNGISISDQEPADQEMRLNYRRELGIPDDCKFIVGTVGNLRQDRQPWLYIEIFSEMARVLGSKVHFVIAGGGKESEFDHLKLVINKHGLEDRVHLPGLALNPDIPRSIMDLYLTLNVGPLTGIAALEAASSLLPILAIQLRAEYNCGSEDWIWSSSNPVKLAEKAIELIQSPVDRKALAEKQAGYVRAHHTTEMMMKTYFKLYQVAIERAQQ